MCLFRGQSLTMSDSERHPVSQQARVLSETFVASTAPLLAIGTALLCRRLYVRAMQSWILGWDDLFIVFGFVSNILPPHTPNST